MWQIKKIIIENILSFSKEEIELKNNQLTLIQGINSTDSGAHSNGSGKSTILECIKLSLTTNTIKNIKKKDIIRNGQSEGYLEMLLKNNSTGDEMLIKKTLHVSKSNKCEIIFNGKLQENLIDLNINESDRFILSKLEISSEELDNYFLISKERYISFFNSPDRSKKELLNQFSKADKLDSIDEFIKSDLKDLENKRASLENSISVFSGKIEVLTNQIQDIDEHKQNLQLSIHKSKENLKESENQIKDLKQQMLKIKDSEYFDKHIKDFDFKIQELKHKSLNEREGKMKLLNETLNQNKKSLEEIKEGEKDVYKMIVESESLLISTTVCPKCSYEFSLKDTDKDLKQIKDILIQTKEIQKEFKEERINAENKIQKIQKEIFSALEENSNKEDLDLLNNKLNDVVKEKGLNEFRQKTLLNEIESLKKIQERYNNQLQEFEKELNVDVKNKIKKEIDSHKNSISEIKKNIEDVEEILIAELSKVQSIINSFKTHIANNSLDYIQKKANEFMEKIKCSYRILINGYKLLSNGKLKDQITIGITRDGNNEESFGRFSGGEKAKADLSCILALNEIINYNVSPNGLDFIAIDEVLESVDEEGFINIINSLKQLNKTVFLITHVSPDYLHDVNKIVVKKQDGVSYIV